jgi:hypothetical protein
MFGLINKKINFRNITSLSQCVLDISEIAKIKNYDDYFYTYTDGTFLINVNTNEPIVTAVECFFI